MLAAFNHRSDHTMLRFSPDMIYIIIQVRVYTERLIGRLYITHRALWIIPIILIRFYIECFKLILGSEFLAHRFDNNEFRNFETT